MSQAQVVSLFATAKTQLATVTSNLTTIQASLLALEQTRVALVAAGGNAAASWLQNAIKQLGQGYTPLTVPGGPGVINAVVAPTQRSRATSRNSVM
jgi:hypothetical protein